VRELLRDPENKLGVNESYMSNMAIIVAAVGHKGPKLLEKGVVGEVLLAGARESSRNSAGARKLNSLGALFFFWSCTWKKSSTCGRALVMSSLVLGA
jgi:hypothetical protein